MKEGYLTNISNMRLHCHMSIKYDAKISDFVSCVYMSIIQSEERTIERIEIFFAADYHEFGFIFINLKRVADHPVIYGG